MARPRRYMELTRRQRRDRFVAMRWRIATDDQGRGVFACRHLLPGTPGWLARGLGEATQTHADVRFLSETRAREGVWYSASLSTVAQAVCEWLNEKICQGLRVIGHAQEYLASDWEGLAKAWSQVDASNWRQAPVSLGCQVSDAYPHALRVIGVVEEQNLDADAIIAFIDQFRAHGETGWSQQIDWNKHHDEISGMVEQQARLYTRLGQASEDQRPEGSMQ